MDTTHSTVRGQWIQHSTVRGQWIHHSTVRGQRIQHKAQLGVGGYNTQHSWGSEDTTQHSHGSVDTKIRRPASGKSEKLLCPPPPGTPAALDQGSPRGWRVQQLLRFPTGGPSSFHFTTFPGSNIHFPPSNTYFPRLNTHFPVILLIV